MNGANPLSPEEYLLRRISACEVKPADETFPWGHFTPTRNDLDGLSLTRATVKTPEQVVEGMRNRCGYYVAKFQVQELIRDRTHPGSHGTYCTGSRLDP